MYGCVQVCMHTLMYEFKRNLCICAPGQRTRTLITLLLIISQNLGRKSKCLSKVEWVNEPWSIQTMVYYTAQSRAELQLYNSVDGSYKHNLNKSSKTYKRSYSINQCTYNSKINSCLGIHTEAVKPKKSQKVIITRVRIVVPSPWEGELCWRTHRVIFTALGLFIPWLQCQLYTVLLSVNCFTIFLNHKILELKDR